MDDAVLLQRLLDKVDKLVDTVSVLSTKVAVYDSINTALEQQKRRVNVLIFTVVGLAVSAAGSIASILAVK